MSGTSNLDECFLFLVIYRISVHISILSSRSKISYYSLQDTNMKTVYSYRTVKPCKTL